VNATRLDNSAKAGKYDGDFIVMEIRPQKLFHEWPHRLEISLTWWNDPYQHRRASRRTTQRSGAQEPDPLEQEAKRPFGARPNPGNGRHSEQAGDPTTAL